MLFQWKFLVHQVDGQLRKVDIETVRYLDDHLNAIADDDVRTVVYDRIIIV